MYHAILVDKSFPDPEFPLKFKIFANRKSDDWTIYGIIATNRDILKIQKHLKQKFYAHLYNDKELIIVFSDKIFRVSRDKSTWSDAVKHGVYLGISKEQLDFIPCRFKDEEEYFKA